MVRCVNSYGGSVVMGSLWWAVRPDMWKNGAAGRGGKDALTRDGKDIRKWETYCVARVRKQAARRYANLLHTAEILDRRLVQSHPDKPAIWRNAEIARRMGIEVYEVVDLLEEVAALMEAEIIA